MLTSNSIIYRHLTKGLRTSLALGFSHSTTDSHHFFGYTSIFWKEGGRRRIGNLLSFWQLSTIISSRESQISFALQMLISSGRFINLRILNFGSMNSMMELELLLSSSVVPIISSIFSQCRTWILSRFTRFDSNTRGNNFFILLHL